MGWLEEQSQKQHVKHDIFVLTAESANTGIDSWILPRKNADIDYDFQHRNWVIPIQDNPGSYVAFILLLLLVRSMLRYHSIFNLCVQLCEVQ